MHRDLIISLAARHKLPPVYPYDYLVTAGGLMSYGLVRQSGGSGRPVFGGFGGRKLTGTKPIQSPRTPFRIPDKKVGHADASR